MEMALPAMPASAGAESRQWKVSVMKSEHSFVRKNGCAWDCEIEPTRGCAAISVRQVEAQYSMQELITFIPCL